MDLKKGSDEIRCSLNGLGKNTSWEQRKLGDVVQRITRKNENMESSLPLTISAQYGLIDQNEFFDKRIASKDVSDYYLVYRGEFAYNKSTSTDAPWGAIKRLDRYEKGVLSTLYIVFRIQNEEETDSDYLVSYYDTELWHNGVQAIAAEGARNHGLLNIAPNDFFETNLLMPESVNEQRMIGTFFKKLDHLITLHQRKYDMLQKVKKSMLEKMFPKNGSKVPEIRFAGFTDDWEQRKVSELVEKYEDPVETPHNGYTRLGIRSHAKGTFHEYVEPGHELETAQMHRVAANKLIFNITFAWEHAVAITDEDDAGKLVSHRFPQFSLSDSLSPEFLQYVILDEDFHHHLYLASPGGAGRNRVLKIKEALDYPIYYPSVNEQHKIGMYFDMLTYLITLHQRQRILDLKWVFSAFSDMLE